LPFLGSKPARMHFLLFSGEMAVIIGSRASGAQKIAFGGAICSTVNNRVFSMGLCEDVRQAEIFRPFFDPLSAVGISPRSYTPHYFRRFASFRGFKSRIVDEGRQAR